MLWNGEANWEFSACRLIVTVYLPLWPEYLSFLMQRKPFMCFGLKINLLQITRLLSIGLSSDRSYSKALFRYLL
jgi:hypothetical protein